MFEEQSMISVSFRRGRASGKWGDMESLEKMQTNLKDVN